MRRTFLALVVCIGLWSVAPVSASVGSSFNLNCAYSHSLSDDPIVYPALPGASHLHDFFGNTTTNADSTDATMTNAPTTCQNTHDHAAYWAPAAYINGVRVLPINIKAYYIHQITGTIVAFPTGLKMLAGYANATGPQPTSVVYYGCGSGTGISKVNYPPNCTTGKLQIHVIFPDCGTGALDSEDHRSHMAYSVSHVCPAGYPEHFPQLQMRLNYDVQDARTLTFASGAYYTVHADFWNFWDPTELARLVATI